MTAVVEVRRGSYHDSVTLMAVSRDVARVDGVKAALVAMATELNLAALSDLGFDRDQAKGAGPDDLLVALRAVDQVTLTAAQAAVAEGLSRQGSAGGTAAAPPARTVGQAARATAARGRPASLALVSVPGPHAFPEAMDALRAGLSVMVFSDNVALDQEIVLKAEAARRGLLVMGPDCGTAIVGGVGLGFANATSPGPVGIVAASGTGAQQLTCLLDDAGVGVRAVLGVGGRDLSEAVEAASALAALAALDADPGCDLVIVASKTPAPEVARRVTDAAQACATPVLVAFVGPGHPDLTAVADQALERLGRPPLRPHWWSAPRERGSHTGSLRGLFAGGTLCQEAAAIAGPVLREGDDLVDFGDDRFTLGRAHPMIDQRGRLTAIAEVGERGGDDVVLLDVVLGHGAHPDPAAELAPALRTARRTAADAGRDVALVVSLCASAGDPQDRVRQAEALMAAGASVHLSNAQAARKCVDLLDRGAP